MKSYLQVSIPDMDPYYNILQNNWKIIVLILLVLSLLLLTYFVYKYLKNKNSSETPRKTKPPDSKEEQELEGDSGETVETEFEENERDFKPKKNDVDEELESEDIQEFVSTLGKGEKTLESENKEIDGKGYEVFFEENISDGETTVTVDIFKNREEINLENFEYFIYQNGEKVGKFTEPGDFINIKLIPGANNKIEVKNNEGEIIEEFDDISMETPEANIQNKVNRRSNMVETFEMDLDENVQYSDIKWNIPEGVKVLEKTDNQIKIQYTEPGEKSITGTVMFETGKESSDSINVNISKVEETTEEPEEDVELLEETTEEPEEDVELLEETTEEPEEDVELLEEIPEESGNNTLEAYKEEKDKPLKDEGQFNVSIPGAPISNSTSKEIQFENKYNEIENEEVYDEQDETPYYNIEEWITNDDKEIVGMKVWVYIDGGPIRETLNYKVQGT